MFSTTNGGIGRRPFLLLLVGSVVALLAAMLFLRSPATGLEGDARVFLDRLTEFDVQEGDVINMQFENYLRFDGGGTRDVEPQADVGGDRADRRGGQPLHLDALAGGVVAGE